MLLNNTNTSIRKMIKRIMPTGAYGSGASTNVISKPVSPVVPTSDLNKAHAGVEKAFSMPTLLCKMGVHG